MTRMLDGFSYSCILAGDALLSISPIESSVICMLGIDANEVWSQERRPLRAVEVY